MNKREVLEILDECPPVSRLRELFTPEQVRQWPDDTIEVLLSLNKVSSPKVTDIMRWMIEECGFSICGIPCNFLLSRMMWCRENIYRLRLMLKHGAVIDNAKTIFHTNCGERYDHDGSKHTMLLLLIDHGYEPANVKECWCSICRIQTYHDLAESRRLTHRCVIALLGVRRKSPLARRWLPREIVRMIAEMIWRERWK